MYTSTLSERKRCPPDPSETPQKMENCSTETSR
jgi:hypothetical protein